MFLGATERKRELTSWPKTSKPVFHQHLTPALLLFLQFCFLLQLFPTTWQAHFPQVQHSQLPVPHAHSWRSLALLGHRRDTIRGTTKAACLITAYPNSGTRQDCPCYLLFRVLVLIQLWLGAAHSLPFLAAFFSSCDTQRSQSSSHQDARSDRTQGISQCREKGRLEPGQHLPHKGRKGRACHSSPHEPARAELECYRCPQLRQPLQGQS